MRNKKTATSKKILSVFSLVMITVGSVDSIRNLPTIALFGDNILFFFIASIVFFLFPSVLISAELSSAWPEQGGIYNWVKYAFGKQLGFLAAWFLWIENVIWYPAILLFTASTLGYLISPDLANNKYFLITTILVIFWSTTVINLLGMRLSAIFSSVCTIFGILLPMGVIIALGFLWIYLGKPQQVHFGLDSLFPHVKQSNLWAGVTGIMMAFCGMEIATSHASDVRNPHYAFPRAFLISTIILIITLTLGSATIAIVLPEHQINLMVGIMQIFKTFLVAYDLHIIIPIVGVVVILGSIGNLNNWVIAPTKGLVIAAKDGHLPLHFAKENRFNSPHFILMYQAIIVTLLMVVLLLIPSISGSYWLLTVLTTQAYMVMYILMFAAALRLRFKHPSKHRPFCIPGKYFGITITAIAGIIGAGIGFMAGFIMPPDIKLGSNMQFEYILLIGLLLISAPPFIIYKFRGKLVKDSSYNENLAAESIAINSDE
jgi:glutamate:GABA antiporter